MPERSDSRIRTSRLPNPRLVTGLGVQRPKLIDFEYLVVPAVTPLTEQHRSMRRDFDGKSDCEQTRCEQDEQKQCSKKVQQTFRSRILREQPRAPCRS